MAPPLRRLVTSQLRADAVGHLALAALVLVTTFLAVAAPRALTAASDDALRRTLREVPGAGQDVLVRAYPSSYGEGVAAPASFLPEVTDGLLGVLGPAYRAHLATARYSVATGDYLVHDLRTHRPTAPEPGLLAVRLQQDALERVRFTSGTAPKPAQSFERSVPLPIALSVATAKVLHVRAGERIELPPSSSNTSPVAVAAVVSGLYEPLDARDPLWQDEPRMLNPLHQVGSGLAGAIPWSTVGLAAPTSYDALVNRVGGASLHYGWRLSLDPSGIDGTDVSALVGGIGRVRSAPAERLNSPYSLSVTSGLADVLTSFRAMSATATAVVSVAVTAVVAAGAAALLLTAQVTLARRSAALALLAARGASRRQLFGLLVVENLVVAVPAGAVGGGVGVLLVSSRAVVASELLALAVVGSSVLLGAVLAVLPAPRPSPRFRHEAAVRRLAIDALVLALAAFGVLSFRGRGLEQDASSAGVDAYLATVPVLVGLAAIVVVRWLYPPTVALVARAAARRPGLVLFVGLRRAARDRLGTGMPLAVLLLSLGLAVFAGALQTAIDMGQQAAAWRTVGADARVQGPALDDAAVARVRALPQVHEVVGGYIDPGAQADDAAHDVAVRLVALPLRNYQGLLRRAPDAPPVLARVDKEGAARGQTASAWVSRPLGGLSGTVEVTTTAGSVVVAVRGADPSVALVGGAAPDAGSADAPPVVLVSYDALERAVGSSLRPNVLYVDGAPTSRSLARAAAGAAGPDAAKVSASTRADVYTGLHEAPLVRSARIAFRAGIAIAAGYALLAVLLSLLLTAASRHRLLSTLRTLGLTGRQATGLLVVELGPPTVLAVGIGIALGWALPRLLGPGIDVRAFTGGLAPAGHPIDAGLTARLAAGLIGLVAAAVLISARVGAGGALGQALRMTGRE